MYFTLHMYFCYVVPEHGFDYLIFFNLPKPKSETLRKEPEGLTGSILNVGKYLFASC